MKTKINLYQTDAHIQPNATKLIGHSFTVQMDKYPKHTVKATQDFWRQRSQSNRACFSVTEDKTEGRKTHKQAATQGGCSEDLAKHL